MKNEQLDFDFEEMENVVPPKDIFAFNETRSCADIRRMYVNNQLDISPKFQRAAEVWKIPAKTRFLDSLLKNLPIPSMCISFDISGQKRIVIDGVQRISTIVQFLNATENHDGKFVLSDLEDVDQRLSGKKAKEIKEKYPEIIESIENVSIPITVLRCDLSKNDHMQYIFTIFHRLNTGGVKLNNQEIRNCIFGGSFNDLLFDCADKDDNRKILNEFLGKNVRFKYQEFILRFFAFQDSLDSYTGYLVTFLNDYMNKNKDLNKDLVSSKYETFSKVIKIACQLKNKEDLSKKIVLETVLYGIGKNIDLLANLGSEEIEERYRKLIFFLRKNEQEYLQEGVSKKNKVSERLSQAEKIFRSN